MSAAPTPRRRLALIAGVVAVLVVAGGLLLRTASGRHWVGEVLVSLVDTWLVPEVELGGFTLEGPTTARLDDLQLIASDGRPIFEVAHLTVSLADVPSEGEPLRIGRLVLDHPTIYLRPDPTQLGFVPMGFSPLLEPDPLADPDAVAVHLRPSEVLELRHVEIIDGVLVVEDGQKKVLEVDGIELDLEADPVATPAGTPGHHAKVVFGHPPGVVVELDGHVDIDNQVAWLEQGDLSVELSDPALVAKLTPKLQALLKTHELAGSITGELTGRFDFRDPERSKAKVSLDVQGVHGAAGDWRLPIENATVQAEFAAGLAHIEQASAQMLGGTLSLSQADLAMARARVALAGDLQMQHLQLHQLLRRGSDDPNRQSVLDGTGRLFLASEDFSLGLVLENLTMGPPGASPVVSLRRGEVRDLRTQATGVPIVVEGVDVDGLEVDLQLIDGGFRGWPLPPPASTPTERIGPHWSERFEVAEVVLSDSAVQIAPAGQAPWRLPGISGTLKSLGGSEPAVLNAALDAGPAGVRASGSLDLQALVLHFSTWSIRADAASPATHSLLPPGLRETVVSLVPSGQVQGTGSARFPLGSGAPRVDLDVALTAGAVALGGMRMPVSSGSASLSVDQGSTRVANGELDGAGGTLTVPAAVLDASNTLTVSAQAAGIRLDRITTGAGKKLGVGRLSGKADASVQFVQKAGGTAIAGVTVNDAKVTVDGDPVGKMVWSDVDVSSERSGDQLHVSATATAGSGGTVRVAGTMPIGGDTLTLHTVDVAVDLADPSGRRSLPPAVQSALADIRAGRLTVVGDGVVSFADPLRGSTAATTVAIEGGAWHYAGYRFGGLSGSAPLALSEAVLRSSGGAITGLGGRLGVTEAYWAVLDDRGQVRWSLSGLDLKTLKAIEGSPNTLEGMVKGKGKVDLKVTAEDGLVVTAGQGSLHVRDGKLLSVPALAALSKEGDKTGDDAMNARFRLDRRGAELRTLVIDLGPVRYQGSGTLRWTGAIDIHLEASARPGERATLAELAARLVAWDIRGTLDAPHAQALPLGIDTRTFDQKAQDPRTVVNQEAVEAVMGEDDAGLDDLPEAGANVAPPPPDRTEFGDFDDLDDEVDF